MNPKWLMHCRMEGSAGRERVFSGKYVTDKNLPYSHSRHIHLFAKKSTHLRQRNRHLIIIVVIALTVHQSLGGRPPPLTATARRSSLRDEAAADVFLATDADALLFVGKLSGQVQLYGGKGEEGWGLTDRDG